MTLYATTFSLGLPGVESQYVELTPVVVGDFLQNAVAFGKIGFNWEELSESGNEYLLTPDVIAYFVNRWNWRALSRNSNLKLNFTFIDRFIDKWDWAELIDCWRREEFYSKEFFDKYRSHIPLNAFIEGSRLANELVEKEAEIIKKELTSHC